ncbi:MAG: hypothetical protein IJA15_04520 [Clostridia bacterium]|nr:hypothetical protein [Clostridia bacterium]
MKSLLISGINGKVGSHLLRLSKKYQLNVVCGVDRKTFCEADCPVYTDFSQVKERVDVIIDFSSPALCEQALDFAFKERCVFISGTTALLANQKAKLKELSTKVAVCHANNFSKNVIHFTQAATVLKNSLEEFDCILIEEHNKLKKDAPSGTAKKIANELSISQVFPIRGGNISGLHKIIFLGDGEEIEITHRAYEKSVFAKGALYCANRLLQKEKGLYTIEQLINE